MPEYEAKLPHIPQEGVEIKFDTKEDGALVILDHREGLAITIYKEDIVGLILALAAQTPKIEIPKWCIIDRKKDKVYFLLKGLSETEREAGLTDEAPLGWTVQEAIAIFLHGLQQALQSKRKEGEKDV